MMEDIKRNWKTTSVGIFVFVVVVFYLTQKLIRNEPIDLQTTIAAIVGGAISVGFFSSKDGNVTGGTRPATPEAAQRIGVPLKTPPAALALLLMLCAGSGLACASMRGAQGSTGTVDLGRGYVCAGTVGAVDPATCTKAFAFSCEAPLPKDAAGACKLDSLTAEVPFRPAPEWKCLVTAAAGLTPCSKIITTTCLQPIPRDASGACL